MHAVYVFIGESFALMSFVVEMHRLGLVDAGEHAVVAVDSSIDEVTDDHDRCSKFILPLMDTPCEREDFR